MDMGVRATDVRKRKMYIRERDCGLGSAGSGQDNTVVRFCEHSDEISCNISVVSGDRAAWSV